MLKRCDVTLMSNPTCNRSADILEDDFKYYDKDGFELNVAEQKFYSAMGYPINHPILNHCCWQEPWFSLEDSANKLILDHSMFLCRCDYADDALDLLQQFKKIVPTAEYLIRTRTKWGLDFALDALDAQGNIFEVIHVEFDSFNYDEFINKMLALEHTIMHTDWVSAAKSIDDHKQEWGHLTGFSSNDWKANFLFGWHKSETTHKSYNSTYTP
jgi:hypothetical protein